MRKLTILSVILTCISCKNFDQKAALKKQVIGDWKNKTTSEKFKILKNNQFYYQDNSEENLISFYSIGTWKIENDTLFFTSKMPKECLHVHKFGGSCVDSNFSGDFLIETTILDCTPKNAKKYFIKFTNEKFILRNDSLLYIPPCKINREISFKRESKN